MAPVRQAGQTGWVGGLPASVPSTACGIRKTPQDPEGPAGGLRCQKAGLCQELAELCTFHTELQSFVFSPLPPGCLQRDRNLKTDVVPPPGAARLWRLPSGASGWGRVPETGHRGPSLGERSRESLCWICRSGRDSVGPEKYFRHRRVCVTYVSPGPLWSPGTRILGAGETSLGYEGWLLC